jgi:hypothetical protein
MTQPVPDQDFKVSNWEGSWWSGGKMYEAEANDIKSRPSKKPGYLK